MRACLLIVALGFLTFGCGGSSSDGSVNIGGSQQVGSLVVDGQVKAAVTAAGGDYTVSGLSGNLKTVTLLDRSPTLAETEIFFHRAYLGGHEMAAVAPDGTGLRRVCWVGGRFDDMDVNPNGYYAYFHDWITHEMFYVAASGGNIVRIAPSQTIYSFDTTPSGSFIYFIDGFGNLYKCSSTGASITLLNGSLGGKLVGTLNDNEFVHWKQTGTTTKTVTVYRTLTGGNIRTIATWTNFELLHAATSPDGTWSLLVVKDNATAKYLVRRIRYGPNIEAIDTIVSDLDVAPGPYSISPDNSQVAYVEGGNLYVAPANLAGSQLVHSCIDTSYAAWGSNRKARTLVGSGTFASGASAVLISESGDFTRLAVLVDSTTRSSTTLQKVAEGNTNIVMKVEADQLIKLYYTDTNNFTLVPVVQSGTGIKGALISLNSGSGMVSSIITYSVTPIIRRLAGGRLIIEGDNMIEAVDVSQKRRVAYPKRVEL